MTSYLSTVINFIWMALHEVIVNGRGCFSFRMRKTATRQVKPQEQRDSSENLTLKHFRQSASAGQENIYG